MVTDECWDNGDISACARAIHVRSTTPMGYMFPIYTKTDMGPVMTVLVKNEDTRFG